MRKPSARVGRASLDAQKDEIMRYVQYKGMDEYRGIEDGIQNNTL